MPPARYYRSGKKAGRRAGKPKTQMGQALQVFWFPAKQAVDFNALASGGDIGALLVDHSAEFASSVMKFRKLTIRWWCQGSDLAAWRCRALAVAVYKQDQDDSATPLSLDSEEAIQESREEGKMLRGPWVIITPEVTVEGYAPAMSGLFKPIVLKNLVLEEENDLVISFTNLDDTAFAASSMIINLQRMGYYRKLPV